MTTSEEFQNLITSSLLDHDWHQSVHEDDPQCGPDQWRGWSRKQVYDLPTTSDELLRSFLDWCHDYPNRRSREAAVRAEINRRSITSKGTTDHE